MNDVDTVALVVLDDAWRPRHGIALHGDWRMTMNQLLALGGRWLTLHQQRATAPSADPRAADIALTRSLCRRLRPLDMMLADHVIRAGEDRFSFRAAGLL